MSIRRSPPARPFPDVEMSRSLPSLESSDRRSSTILGERRTRRYRFKEYADSDIRWRRVNQLGGLGSPTANLKCIGNAAIAKYCRTGAGGGLRTEITEICQPAVSRVVTSGTSAACIIIYCTWTCTRDAPPSVVFARGRAKRVQQVMRARRCICANPALFDLMARTVVTAALGDRHVAHDAAQTRVRRVPLSESSALSSGCRRSTGPVRGESPWRRAGERVCARNEPGGVSGLLEGAESPGESR